MRATVRLPGMRRAFSPCPPDRTRLPLHVGRIASGRRKVRAHHRTIRRTRAAAIRAPSWIVQEAETCQAEGVAASLTESRVASSLKHRRAASGLRQRPIASRPISCPSVIRKNFRISDFARCSFIHRCRYAVQHIVTAKFLVGALFVVTLTGEIYVCNGAILSKRPPRGNSETDTSRFVAFGLVVALGGAIGATTENRWNDAQARCFQIYDA